MRTGTHLDFWVQGKHAYWYASRFWVQGKWKHASVFVFVAIFSAGAIFQLLVFSDFGNFLEDSFLAFFSASPTQSHIPACEI
jgi:hypothetical protein